MVAKERGSGAWILFPDKINSLQELKLPIVVGKSPVYPTPVMFTPMTLPVESHVTPLLEEEHNCGTFGFPSVQPGSVKANKSHRTLFSVVGKKVGDSGEDVGALEGKCEGKWLENSTDGILLEAMISEG